ncbi:MAG: hypothetical protein Q8941_09795 [Bacteroidota bacterium]|nr:hypothetical protein [Bacteroidota bacterium]
MKKIASLYAVISSLPILSFAHEGHGTTDGYTIKHYFVEPEHFFVMVGVLALGIAYFRYIKKEKRR